MQVALSLFFKNMLRDTFTLWYKVPKASYISLAVFFPAIWGIWWSFTESNRIHFSTISFLLCSTRSLQFVGITTTFSKKYYKFSIFRSFYNLNFHGTKLEAPSNKRLSYILRVSIIATSSNKLHYEIIASIRDFYPTTLLRSMCWSLAQFYFYQWSLDILPTKTSWQLSTLDNLPLQNMDLIPCWFS